MAGINVPWICSKKKEKERNASLYGCGGGETHDVAFGGLGVHINRLYSYSMNGLLRECIARVYSYVSSPTQAKIELYSTPASQTLSWVYSP